MSLLPREQPAIPGLTVATHYQTSTRAGGDYYDWQALPDGNWIITLADVSGHGIGPALVTADEVGDPGRLRRLRVHVCHRFRR